MTSSDTFALTASSLSSLFGVGIYFETVLANLMGKFKIDDALLKTYDFEAKSLNTIPDWCTLPEVYLRAPPSKTFEHEIYSDSSQF